MHKKIVLISLLGLFSCKTESDKPLVIPETSIHSSSVDNSMYTQPEDPYIMMSATFAGEPSISEIQPLLEEVLRLHDVPATDNNRLELANSLYNMRINSKIGVTEMQILKHMYQNHTPGVSLSEQIGTSAAFLELNN